MSQLRSGSVEIVPVLPNDMSTLRNLLQLYQYDFSEIEPTQVDRDGRFHQLNTVQFEHAYFIHADGALAGFALVSRQPSRLRESETVWWMEEFFVMRRHRRASIGSRAARAVIALHPGSWEITQTPNNDAATAFWRTTLTPYKYEDVTYVDPKWGRRPLQRFALERSVSSCLSAADEQQADTPS